MESVTVSCQVKSWMLAEAKRPFYRRVKFDKEAIL